MIRQILQLGNEILRLKSSPVEDLRSIELDSLIEDLSDTLEEAKRRFAYGRGIAAPQIGKLMRVGFIDMPRLRARNCTASNGSHSLLSSSAKTRSQYRDFVDGGLD